MITIMDDGPGFSPEVIPKLGEPYISDRSEARLGGGDMGLGFFIAKTLLERSGATLELANADENAPRIPSAASFDQDEDGLAKWLVQSRESVAAHRSRLEPMVSEALVATVTGSAKNTWETIRYSLLDRSEGTLFGYRMDNFVAVIELHWLVVVNWVVSHI